MEKVIDSILRAGTVPPLAARLWLFVGQRRFGSLSNDLNWSAFLNNRFYYGFNRSVFRLCLWSFGRDLNWGILFDYRLCHGFSWSFLSWCGFRRRFACAHDLELSSLMEKPVDQLGFDVGKVSIKLNNLTPW